MRVECGSAELVGPRTGESTITAPRLRRQVEERRAEGAAQVRPEEPSRSKVQPGAVAYSYSAEGCSSRLACPKGLFILNGTTAKTRSP